MASLVDQTVGLAETFCEDPSENVPVAVTVSDWPTLTVLVDGVTVIPVSVAGGGPGAVTVSTVVPEIEPSCALIVEVPAATAVESPELLIVAVAVVLLDHVGAAQGWL